MPVDLFNFENNPAVKGSKSRKVARKVVPKVLLSEATPEQISELKEARLEKLKAKLKALDDQIRALRAQADQITDQIDEWGNL